MVDPMSRFSDRKVFTAHADPYSFRIMYDTEFDPNNFGCCTPEKVKQSTYIWVMENRIEYNQPFSGCCGAYADRISVIYFDDPIVEKAVPRPAGWCRKTCCKATDSILLQDRCCFGCCVWRQIRLQGMKDSTALAEAINQQRSRALTSVGMKV